MTRQADGGGVTVWFTGLPSAGKTTIVEPPERSADRVLALLADARVPADGYRAAAKG
jgi:adenylylsulfate kinase-like enzyme